MRMYMRVNAKTIATSVAVAAGMLALPSVSRAQMPQPAPVAVAPPQPPGIWLYGQPYLRADIGGAFSLDQHYHSTDPTAPNALLGPGASINGGVAPTGAFDVGLGSRVLPYFRWDATLSYIPAMDFSGSFNTAPGTSASARVDSLVGMLNGYLDLAGLGYYFGPFQPYLDAGVGAASNHLASMDTASAAGTIGGDTHTSLAWGLGAGVAMPVGPRTTFDLSYKYLDLGEAETASTDSAGSLSPLKANVKTNLVLAGLRFGF